jgi:predicted house-cleaning noncanonical NTP pyrophosphatase (MazG superfamily)
MTMSEEEYRQALREKLIEEAREASEADLHHLVFELADLYEVIDALMTSYGISQETVKAEQQRKRTERGGFDGRIQLLWTE